MLQRIRVGIKVFIREGSTERNVDRLIRAVVEDKLDTEHLMFCTDDKHIGDIRREGHINYNVNRAIELGMEPMEAIRMAMITPTPVRTYPDWIKDTVRLKNPITADSFKVEAPGASEGDRVQVRVIRLVPSQIINEEETAVLKVGRSGVDSDASQDVIKLSVVERYGKNGNVETGFVKGFHITKGAMAYSMSHDHHNIVVTGVNESDMAQAVLEVSRLHGGLAVVCDGRVLASMELPIGGLMSEKGPDEVEKELDGLNEAARMLGCSVDAPFMALSFISLPTVPQLGLTDKGLVDVLNHKLIPVVL